MRLFNGFLSMFLLQRTFVCVISTSIVSLASLKRAGSVMIGAFEGVRDVGMGSFQVKGTNF